MDEEAEVANSNKQTTSTKSSKRKESALTHSAGKDEGAEASFIISKKKKSASIHSMSEDEEAEAPTSSFQLLDIDDVTKHTAEHINRIFLLNSTKVPEGGPEGIALDKLTISNYKNADSSKLNDECLPFLIRPCFIQYLNLFHELKRAFDKSGKTSSFRTYYNGHVLDGQDGNGKSYLLYYIVQFCRASGWLVLYIPRAGNIAQMEDNVAANNIINSLLKAEYTKLQAIQYNSTKTLAQYISAGINTSESFKTFENVIDIFSNSLLPYPVLFAVDEFNTYPNCKVLRLFYKSMISSLKSGFWVYAIASCFNPFDWDTINYDDKENILKNIPSYTEEEFKSILKCQQYYKRLPKDLSLDQIECIRENSGFVPRMVFYWYSVWSVNLEAPFEIVRDGKHGYNERAIYHYYSRIWEIMNKSKTASSLEKSIIYNYAASLVMNRKPEWALQWESSGLFHKKTSTDYYSFYTICPPVLKAFIKYFLEVTEPTLNTLLMDPRTNWLCLKLFFILHFHGNSKSVIFRNKDLLGKFRNPKELRLDVSNVIEVTGPIKALRPGTFLVLRDLNQYYYCDFVAYSENSELFFIKVSNSKYNHFGVDHLKSRYEDKPILNHFMDICKTKDGDKRFKSLRHAKRNLLHSGLPNGVYFVYITSSTSVVTKENNHHNYPVVLVDRSELVNALGAEWEYYLSYLKDNR